MNKRQTGFTLLELAITVVVAGILAAIAITSYQSYILKSNRTDALTTLLSMQLKEEDYRSNNSTYGTLAQIGQSSTTTSGKYNLTVTNNTATGYTLTATAQGNQANDSDSGSSCATLTLTVSSGTTTKTPSACWIGN